MAEAPQYELIDLSDEDIARVSDQWATAVRKEVETGVIDEDECRAALDGDPLFGSTTGWRPERQGYARRSTETPYASSSLCHRPASIGLFGVGGLTVVKDSSGAFVRNAPLSPA